MSHTGHSPLLSRPFHPVALLQRKRDGHELSAEEIEQLVYAIALRSSNSQRPGTAQRSGSTQPLISDAQISAFLMAAFIHGLSAAELAALTRAMRYSGEVFDKHSLVQAGAAGAGEDGPLPFTIDKHSTGGVGDKTSLLLAPILAAAGLAAPLASGLPSVVVPMISGRSLGHTGGTLDKLETIPGFQTQLPLERFAAILRRCGAALIGQTPDVVPADRILYALRDHTGTVEHPALITASIMSKKLAEDLDALVLDVKTGSGAFMKREEDARTLARLMVETGTASGTRTVALLTSMDQPLGRFAGNWLEVRECVEILQGHRYPLSADLLSLTNTLAGWMLYLAGRAESPEAGHLLSNKLLADGSAYGAWCRLVEAHDGDTAVFEDPTRFPADSALPEPPFTRTLRAEEAGYLAAMDCTEVGWAVQRLGAGRTAPGEPVSARAGLEFHVKLGSRVHPGTPLVTLYADSERQLDEPEAMLRRTLNFSATRPTPEPLVREILQAE